MTKLADTALCSYERAQQIFTVPSASGLAQTDPVLASEAVAELAEALPWSPIERPPLPERGELLISAAARLCGWRDVLDLVALDQASHQADHVAEREQHDAHRRVREVASGFHARLHAALAAGSPPPAPSSAELAAMQEALTLDALWQGAEPHGGQAHGRDRRVLNTRALELLQRRDSPRLIELAAYSVALQVWATSVQRHSGRHAPGQAQGQQHRLAHKLTRAADTYQPLFKTWHNQRPADGLDGLDHRTPRLALIVLADVLVSREPSDERSLSALAATPIEAP